MAHPLYTDKLAYVNLYFDTSAVPEDKLPYLYLLSCILGRMDTKNYSYSEMMVKAASKFGDFSFIPQAFAKYKDSSVYYPKFTVSMYALSSDLPEVFEILGEIVNNTKFYNTLLLGQYIKQIRSGLEYTLTSSPKSYQTTRLQSYFMDIGKYNEVGNIEFYNFICNLDDNFSQKSGEIDKNLQEVMKTVFNRKGLVASITDGESEYSNFSEGFKKFADGLSNEEIVPQNYTFDTKVKNEGITIASQVQYVAKGGDYKKLGYEYSGKMRVLSTILDNEYLSQKVRLEGAAYGSGSVISDNGFFGFLSWYDPNLKETLDIYDKASEFLENFNPDQKTMNGYIISTIGKTETSDDPIALGMLSDAYYIRGITQEDLQKEREEVLSTSVEDIRAYSKMISDIMSQNYINVIGSDAAINNNKELFESIHPMLNN